MIAHVKNSLFENKVLPMNSLQEALNHPRAFCKRKGTNLFGVGEDGVMKGEEFFWNLLGLKAIKEVGIGFKNVFFEGPEVDVFSFPSQHGPPVSLVSYAFGHFHLDHAREVTILHHHQGKGLPGPLIDPPSGDLGRAGDSHLGP